MNFFLIKLRCFFRGNGGTVNVLRISGPQGYPDCGTQKVCTFFLSLTIFPDCAFI